MNRPFFVRFLEAEEMQAVQGGEVGGQPNHNASGTAFVKNPNAQGPIFVTLKAGKCGNDCDIPDPDGSFLL